MQARKRERRLRKRQRFAFWSFLTVCALFLSAGVLTFVDEQHANTMELGPSSLVATTPTPAETSPAPVETPTAVPAPEPTPEPVATPWQFTSATLSIPSIGLEGQIAPYTPEQLVSTTVYNSDGSAATGWAVEPPDVATVSWYTGIEGGILSATATNCAYLYGHSYLDEWAIFNDIPNIQPGSTATINTGSGENLTYAYQDSFKLEKSSISADPRMTEGAPGCLILITCHRDGLRDANGHTVENTVVRLQLVPEKASSSNSKMVADRLR